MKCRVRNCTNDLPVFPGNCGRDTQEFDLVPISNTANTELSSKLIRMVTGPSSHLAQHTLLKYNWMVCGQDGGSTAKFSRSKPILLSEWKLTLSILLTATTEHRKELHKMGITINNSHNNKNTHTYNVMT